MTTTGSALSLIKMTRAEAYQMVRSAAAQEFANQRSSQVSDRTEFEQNYGSTVELDSHFVNDLRAMMLRASAIAMSSGSTKSTYDKTVIPNKTLEKVASVLAGAVGECELYLAQRRVRSMFAAPTESDYLAPSYNGKVGDPYTWVGDRARHVVEKVLQNVQLVDDVMPASIRDLELEVKKICQHELITGQIPDEYHNDQGDGRCDDTGGMWMHCSKGCGFGGLELTLHGEKVFLSDEQQQKLELESICRDGVMRLPAGMTLEAYEKMSIKKRSEIAMKIGEELDAEG